MDPGFHRGDGVGAESTHLPALRARKEDIHPLARHFLRKFSTATGRNVSEIDEEARRKLDAYDWPGNVRELANVIERAVVLGSGSTLTLDDVPGRIAETGFGSAVLSGRNECGKKGVTVKSACHHPWESIRRRQVAGA